jgi:hypothetical protein
MPVLIWSQSDHDQNILNSWCKEQSHRLCLPIKNETWAQQYLKKHSNQIHCILLNLDDHSLAALSFIEMLNQVARAQRLGLIVIASQLTASSLNIFRQAHFLKPVFLERPLGKAQFYKAIQIAFKKCLGTNQHLFGLNLSPDFQNQLTLAVSKNTANNQAVNSLFCKATFCETAPQLIEKLRENRFPCVILLHPQLEMRFIRWLQAYTKKYAHLVMIIVVIQEEQPHRPGQTPGSFLLSEHALHLGALNDWPDVFSQLYQKVVSHVPAYQALSALKTPFPARDGSKKHIRRLALELNRQYPGFASLVAGLAEAYLDHAQLAKAYFYAQKAKELNLYCVKAHFVTLACHLKLYKPDQAIYQGYQAIACCPHNFNILNMTYKLFTQYHNPKEAQLLEEKIKRIPSAKHNES